MKFSEGMRLIKCFCRLFSYNGQPASAWRADLRRETDLFDNVVDYGVIFGEACGEQLGRVSTIAHCSKEHLSCTLCWLSGDTAA